MLTTVSAERKHSKKRDAILEAIKSTTSHPSAQWVYEKLKPRIPDLSLGTVYRNINLFQREGEVVSVGVVEGEERFDGTVSPHPHLICSGCGRVLDCPTQSIEGIPGTDFEDFAVDYRKTVFYGVCKDCQRS